MEAAYKIMTAITAAQLSYSQLETALGDIYLTGEQSISKLRARYKHFQKIGILGRRPGTGSKLKYGLEDFCRILLAMELSEFGLDPLSIAEMGNMLFFDDKDQPLYQDSPLTMLISTTIGFTAPVPIQPSKYLVFAPRVMSSRWMHPGEQITKWPKSWTLVTVESKKQLAQAVESVEQDGGSSTAIINLSSLGARAAQALIPLVISFSDGVDP